MSEAQAPAPYRVLARKYRPASFEDLIGQEPMVRTLTNAFETGRIAQAWMLTGVRGVGKTTTARILARALNYATDEIDQPTIHMREPGVHDQAIMEGRHVDVVEMDAASHTGIDDIREIIAQVRYRPVSARYKVYIIDEVHMLSNQAFNGLLKTLEEPPEHVKFVFATTEIRKVPITVLSRCQRFDLRRIEATTLMQHLSRVARAEGVEAEEDALRLIARAAEGSVRDSLSLMDQAIAHGAGSIQAATVRDMLGLADRVRVIDLFETLMAGDGRAALAEIRSQYEAGADPLVVLTDLADFTHLVTTLRYVPEAAGEATLSPMEAERGLALSKSLSVRTLGQVWQLLLKAIEETRASSVPRQAAEMALIRISHAADLPSPDELLALLRNGGGDGLPAPRGAGPASPGAPAGNGQAPSAPAMAAAMPAGAPPAGPQTAGGETLRGTAALRAMAGPRLSLASSAPAAQPGEARPLQAPEPAEIRIASLEDFVALAEQKRDSRIRMFVRRYVVPVSVEPGRLEIALTPEAPATLPGDIAKRLLDWTGRRWVVTVAGTGAGETIEARETQTRQTMLSDAALDPEVAAVLAAFPGAKVTDVRLKGVAEEAEPLPVPDVEEDRFDDPAEYADDDDDF
ncbi:DNA polymerase III subunit gamma/tau [Aurantimonas sp. Leaf443]|nr:DNA polymerase III subunit gamma/tau [Aurantimonas sp. Leaf443]